PLSHAVAHRAGLDDTAPPSRLEDAYAELVNARPHLSAHVKYGRRPDATFYWDFPRNSRKSAALAYTGLRVCNAVTHQALPFEFNSSMGQAVGRLIGQLDGSRTVADIRTTAEATGMAAASLGEILEILKKSDCLAV